MIKKIVYIFIAIVFFSVLFQDNSPKAYSWGFYGHKKINYMAVFTLPPEMIDFYKKHIDYISAHSVDPDKRRYAFDKEAPRHYIDIDHYITDQEPNPFKLMPRLWKDAKKKYTEDTLQAYGIVPWHTILMVHKLSKAFKAGDYDRILQLSAELGHYVADAHVPLHTTVNYNGQLTNQKGIHGFWESRIPELNADDYDFFVGRAKEVHNLSDNIWGVVSESFAAVDSVLDFERQLSKSWDRDKKFSYESRGQSTVKVYSENYTQAYDQMMGDMVERRMCAAIITVGSYWYTAWIRAGKPDLSVLKNRHRSEKVRKQHEELEKAYQKGQIKGRAHPH